MIYLDAQKGLCEKLDINYDDVAAGLHGLFSLSNIKSYLKTAILKVWDLHPWDFSEGDEKITSYNTDYYDYPQQYISGSINYLTVAGEEFDKKDWRDYMNKLKTDSNCKDKIFAERKREVFINKNAYSIGDEIVM